MADIISRTRLYSLQEIRKEVFGDTISQSFLYRETQTGRLKSMKIGDRVYVDSSDLRVYLDNARRQQGGES